MSRIFKKNDIQVDTENKVFIKSQDKEKKTVTTENIEKVTPQKATYLASEILEKANLEANEIIDKAYIKKQQILNEANEQEKEVYEKARKLGYDDGYNEGYDIGVVTAESSLDDLKQQANDELIQIEITKENLTYSVENDMVDLVNDIVKKLTYDALDLNPDLLAVLVKRGISNATIQDKVSIKVSEFDYDTVVENKEKFTKLIDSSKEIEILKDFSLRKNDCLLETEFGNIDCGLDQELTSIKESLYFILNDR